MKENFEDFLSYNIQLCDEMNADRVVPKMDKILNPFK
jgi:hypothetical protein